MRPIYAPSVITEALFFIKYIIYLSVTPENWYVISVCYYWRTILWGVCVSYYFYNYLT